MQQVQYSRLKKKAPGEINYFESIKSLVLWMTKLDSCFSYFICCKNSFLKTVFFLIPIFNLTLGCLEAQVGNNNKSRKQRTDEQKCQKQSYFCDLDSIYAPLPSAYTHLTA